MGAAKSSPMSTQQRNVSMPYPSHFYYCKPFQHMKDNLYIRKALSYPNDDLFRARISHDEWNYFADEILKAHYENFPNFGFLGVIYICLPVYVCYDCRIRAGELRTLYKVTAKFNRYLFLPRGIRCHVQLAEAEGCAAQVFSLKFNMAEPAFASSQLDIWEESDHYVNHICCFRTPTYLIESKAHDDALQLKFGADNVVFQAKNSPPILESVPKWKPAKAKKRSPTGSTHSIVPGPTI